MTRDQPAAVSGATRAARTVASPADASAAQPQGEDVLGGGPPARVLVGGQDEQAAGEQGQPRGAGRQAGRGGERAVGEHGGAG